MTTNSKMRSDFEAWWSEFQETHEEWPFADKEALLFAAWETALSQHQAKVSQPTNQTLLLQLLDSVSGECYMGKEWEEEAARKLKLAAMEPKP